MLNILHPERFNECKKEHVPCKLAHLFFKDIKTSWTLWDIMHMVDLLQRHLGVSYLSCPVPSEVPTAGLRLES